jgi:hypothetical protein
MYSETDNILNSKGIDKFRQRAIALKRVSFVLLILACFKLCLTLTFWRDGIGVSAGVNSLKTMQKSKF